MFNLQHNLYMIISAIVTVLILVLAARFVKRQESKDLILKVSAVLCVLIHFSSMAVDYFKDGGTAYVSDVYFLPVYPCNVVMWMLLLAAFISNKKSVLFRVLSEFCLYGGTVCGIIGILLNLNFAANPTLADYDILKGMLSHSVMLLGCLYMLVGGYVKIGIFNVVSVTAGLGTFVVCGYIVNWLYEFFGMTSPDGMFLKSNPYIPVSPMVLGVFVIMIMALVFTLAEGKLEKEERWYTKLMESIKKTK